MSTELFKHILEALKLAPKYLVAVGIVLTFLLFGPRELLQALGVQDVAKDYRSVVGVGLLLCGAILGVGVVQTVYAPLRRIFKRWQFRRHIFQRLKRLTEDEKQILRFYIANQSRSNKLRFDDGIVQGLANDRIIFRASSIGSLVDGFAFNINNVAWDVLNKDQTLLDGTTNTWRTDQSRYF